MEKILPAEGIIFAEVSWVNWEQNEIVKLTEGVNQREQKGRELD